MLLANNSGGSADKLYVNDVFSTFLYDGNGSTQTITNGIDLAGKGGLVWIKRRTISHNVLHDTLRSLPYALVSNSTIAQESQASNITAVNSSGFVIGSGSNANSNTAPYVSWTFRKAPKFFDVVTYTGDGVAGKVVNHSLGIKPGMIIVKKTSSADGWFVYHRSTGATKFLILNLTDQAYTQTNIWNNTEPTDTVFSLGSNSAINNNGDSYVAYLFAHDPSADGIIQCGSFTTDASGNATVNLGWEPQYLLVKTSSAAANWNIVDATRGMIVGASPATADDPLVRANLTDAEVLGGICAPTSTGFLTTGGVNTTYIYLAIRRPNKPPTSGYEVFNPSVYTGNNADNRLIYTGITTDMVWLRQRNGSGAGYEGFLVGDRLRGNAFLKTASTAAEVTVADGLDAQLVSGAEYGNAFSAMSGVWVGNNSGAAVGNANINANTTANNHVALAFKRAPGFFDMVTYTGTGVARTVAHNLGVAPELMIARGRSSDGWWRVYSIFAGVDNYLTLNAADSVASFTGAWYQLPSSTSFGIGAIDVNQTSITCIAYLFATKAGVSKCGSYTGNGSSQTIDCGFATGARFILIKRTDSTGDWYVYDTARTYPAGNDFRLNPNTTTAEASSTDDVDYAASGFIVNQNATTNLNVTSASYIYLAIA